MMQLINSILTGVADLWIYPWRFASPWVALTGASLAAAAVFVALFRVTSNQTAMRRGRDQLLARVLELLLFRHDIGVSLTACWRITVANVRYLAAFAIPMMVSLVPFICLFLQFESWFENRPLRLNEVALIELEIDPAYKVMNAPIAVTSSQSLQVDQPLIRVPLNNEICFGIRANQPGTGWVQVEVGGQVERRAVQTGDELVRVAPHQGRAGVWKEFWNPTVPPLSRNSSLVRFDIRYPSRQLLLGETEIHWTIVAFVLIMLFGLGLGKLFGVRIA